MSGYPDEEPEDTAHSEAYWSEMNKLCGLCGHADHTWERCPLADVLKRVPS